MEVAIIGGGASGLMASITAAERGHGVTLFERQARVGRKLLATGNGRCNLTNKELSLKNYHGASPDFAEYALREFPPERTLDFFASLGLLTVAEPSGRVYPLSDSAGSVLDVLRFAAKARGARILTGAEEERIRRADAGFGLVTAAGEYSAERVIVCCGSLAGGKLGGVKSGYELLGMLGHRRTKLFPALVQLKTDTACVRSLKGVRADAAVKLLRGGELLAASAGEVQFTDYGLSGPAIFEISRAASVAEGERKISLDLTRGLDSDSLRDMLARRCRDFPELTTENLLTGMLHNRLGRTVLRCAGLDLVTPLAALGGAELDRAARAVKSFDFELRGTMGFENAQVAAGGMDTDEFDPETLESRLVPGLFAAGELLDIDGDCGGYNLQWAWSSAMLAGRLGER